MQVILLCGKAKNGKSTFGNFVKASYEKKGKKVCMLEYSDYIRYYIMKYFGWDGDENNKPREFMQQLSTEIIRKQIDPDFLVRRAIEDLKVLSFFFDVAILSGVREEKEITLPKKEFKDCLSVQVVRTDFDNELSERAKKHYTETALDNYHDYDYVIENNGTLEDLKKSAEKFVEEV